MKNENVFEDIKQEIINVIDYGQKKVLHHIRNPNKRRSSIIINGFNKEEKEIQVLFLIFIKIKLLFYFL